MLRKFLLELKAGHLAALREQKGQSIIIFTFAFIGLIAMLGLALDLGLVYIEKVKVNRAADAAALAAVVELPYEQDTINRAIEYIRINGYDVGVDTSILIRGCVVANNTYVNSLGVSHVFNLPGGVAQNVAEPGFTNPITRTALIVGRPYITATQTPARAVFVIDTGGYQANNGDSDDAEECSANNLGTATKLRVAGRVNVRMNFMQFFGFREVPVEDTATAENLTQLDVVIVFDISGSMEDQTICHDCWVRTSYSPNWPNNGYFNPLPYNPAWATTGTGNQSIPASQLCAAFPPQPFITGTLQYLTVEAELYSANVGDWGLDVRTPGQGFWAIQRGSRGSTGLEGSTNNQGNNAGSPANQSSNVCRPNVQGNQIDCTVGTANDDVCATGGTYAVDCSAYISARPFISYGQRPGSIPNLTGAAYNADCFTNSGGVGSLSGNCWSGNPFNTVPGLERGPSNVPYVEYDFTPTWNGNTYIWLRAQGGGDESYTWAGDSPDQIAPDVNGGSWGNNLSPWRKVVYWQINNGTIYERKDNINADYAAVDANNDGTEDSGEGNSRYFQQFTVGDWRANRALNGNWRWIRLNDDNGSVVNTSVVSGTQYTLRLYQGSPGYMIDKIIFTNDSSGSTPEAGSTATIPTVLRRDANGGTATATDYVNQLGPPASFGSATREACNVCNPAYGYTVDPNQCTCRRRGNESGYGTGLGCTLVSTTTNQLQDQVLSGLYSGLQPIRSAQEAVKRFAQKLDPKFDQLGIVAFSASTDDTNAQVSTRRSKLQCLTWATTQLGNPARCYDPSLGTPLTYTNVISAVERHWATGGTNIALGMREGLEELGVSTPGNTANSGVCTATTNDGNACDRRGAARRVIILMTDGSPNANPGSCNGSGGRPDLWDGLLGTEDADFECAMYFAYLASQENVTVYTIGIGAGANRDLLTAMATGVDPRSGQGDVTYFVGKGGQYFPAAKPTDLDLIFDQILSNIYVRIVG